MSLVPYERYPAPRLRAYEYLLQMALTGRVDVVEAILRNSASWRARAPMDYDLAGYGDILLGAERDPGDPRLGLLALIFDEEMSTVSDKTIDRATVVYDRLLRLTVNGGGDVARVWLQYARTAGRTEVDKGVEWAYVSSHSLPGLGKLEL